MHESGLNSVAFLFLWKAKKVREDAFPLGHSPSHQNATSVFNLSETAKRTMGKAKGWFLLVLVALSQTVNAAWPFGGNYQPEKLTPMNVEDGYDSTQMNLHSARSPFYLVFIQFLFSSFIFVSPTLPFDEQVRLTCKGQGSNSLLDIWRIDCCFR